ncbi:MAG: peptidoglycan DD-metalloendopeptidase family protein [Thermodesulfobacteriota bacterium]
MGLIENNILTAVYRWLRGGAVAVILTTLLTSCFGGGVYHTVKKDETLWRISRTYDVKIGRIARANHINDPRDISIGTRLYIPGATRVLRVPPPDTGRTVRASSKKVRVDLKKYRGDFLWPVKGKLLRTFGTKNGIQNDGIDILARENTAVKAAKEGEVVYVGSSYKAYGRIIIIKHSGDIYTVYANNKSNAVAEGEDVKQGEIIARAGDGQSSDVFVHFEVREGKRPVNPLFFLP